MNLNRPTRLTDSDRKAGVTMAEKVERWKLNQLGAVRFLKQKGYTAKDAYELYRKRYSKEYGSEALQNARSRINSAFWKDSD